ncbi:nucleotidyltransferase substrate binding protein [Clostridium formicaceticum]|uniref:Nucleotidyltransferase n=1 Tax=Clostridium formicaceticum TaxID=1497 RepID=A0AAC9RG47_9CLOT|nr:nucleotidyltransferase substrate binding protein [Clostridium formicaceticum]AOY75870.1 nucleotidyltransferase [Clostridium formicaceticum]ARE86211.1 Nucleotidyltransferase substrate binding protein like protein [Clostridium formicaceticum]
MEKEVRWRQRFENFDKAYKQLNAAILDFENLSVLEKEGLIQRFEYTFELAWKTLKDYLEAKEVNAKFPRDVIKAAFHYEVIKDGEVWMDMLEKRNLLAHTYDEERFHFAIKKIKEEYYEAISQVYNYLGEMR